ncbi:hypothetical protein BJ742DRAFT_839042 [Cladochytrium replicatum]|nr:hypothetical protein BJ742DRAFT_839042 [Cladochytrium replicatum]
MSQSPLHRIVSTASKSFLTGYAIQVLPALVILAIKHISKGRSGSRAFQRRSFAANARRTMLGAFHARMPWFIFVLMSGFEIFNFAFQIAERIMLSGRSKRIEILSASETEPKGSDSLKEKVSNHVEPVYRTFICSALSSALALLIIRRSSRTDLTLFVVVRAIDSFSTFRHDDFRKIAAGWKWRAPLWILDRADVALFVLSCAEIMFSWFYVPEALPSSYGKWITRMAEIHPSLISILRARRAGSLVYHPGNGFPSETSIAAGAVDGGWPPNLQSERNAMKDLLISLGLAPDTWTPSMGHVPCYIVHGTAHTHSCEVHAAYRWLRGFQKALKIYLPVHLLPAVLFNTAKIWPIKHELIITDYEDEEDVEIPVIVTLAGNESSAIRSSEEVSADLKGSPSIDSLSMSSGGFLLSRDHSDGSNGYEADDDYGEGESNGTHDGRDPNELGEDIEMVAIDEEDETGSGLTSPGVRRRPTTVLRGLTRLNEPADSSTTPSTSSNSSDVVDPHRLPPGQLTERSKRIDCYATVRVDLRPLARLILHAIRSSSFLATFIAIFYYSVCITRTRLPHLASRIFRNPYSKPHGPIPPLDPRSPHIDGVHGQLLGTLLCGLSVYLESPRRRREYGLYVLPKALESLWFRMIGRRWAGSKAVEAFTGVAQVAMFGTATGYMVSSVLHNPASVRPAVRALIGWFLVH